MSAYNRDLERISFLRGVQRGHIKMIYRIYFKRGCVQKPDGHAKLLKSRVKNLKIYEEQ